MKKEKTRIDEYDSRSLAHDLVNLFFDFFNQKLFEEKFNKKIRDFGAPIWITDFEIIESDSVIDSIYPREIYTVKCKIHLS